MLKDHSNEIAGAFNEFLNKKAETTYDSKSLKVELGNTAEEISQFIKTAANIILHIKKHREDLSRHFSNKTSEELYEKLSAYLPEDALLERLTIHGTGLLDVLEDTIKNVDELNKLLPEEKKTHEHKR